MCAYFVLQHIGCGYFVDPGKIQVQMSATTGIEQVVKQGFVIYLNTAFIDGNERKNGVEEQNKVSSFQLKELFKFALGRIH